MTEEESKKDDQLGLTLLAEKHKYTANDVGATFGRPSFEAITKI